MIEKLLDILNSFFIENNNSIIKKLNKTIIFLVILIFIITKVLPR